MKDIRCQANDGEKGEAVSPSALQSYGSAEADLSRAIGILDAGLESAFKAKEVSRGHVITAILTAIQEERKECAKIAFEALRPFDKALNWFESRMGDEMSNIDEATHRIGCGISVADLRRASIAITKLSVNRGVPNV